MAANSFEKNIQLTADLLLKFDILMQAGSYSPLDVSKDFLIASRERIEYRGLFDIGIKNQDFNIQLYDESFFQFYEHERNGKRVKRFAYYPNPYKHISRKKEFNELKDLLDTGDLSIQEFEQMLAEIDPVIDIPVIRFDYDDKNYCEDNHPTAHFHIGLYSENRWPSKRNLTPKAFLLHILKMYHFEAISSKTDRATSIENAYVIECNKCELLPKSLFSQKEHERLYIS